MKYFKWIFFGLLILVILLISSIYIFLLTQKPVYNGTLSINGLHEKVDVYFDEYGVPHIYGNNQEDVFQSLGYVHAQERLFQMELIRRVGSGRLSELFGTATLDVDKFFRMLGMSQHAEWTAREFSKRQGDPFYQPTVSYLAGVNAYIENGKTPVEFRLLGIPKNKFTISDMVLIGDYMSFTFQMAFRTDPLMTKIQRKLGEKYLKDLATGWVPGTLRAPHTSDTSSANLASSSFEKIMEELPLKPWLGSNAWALNGKKTQSGKVLFANDTHISYQQPCVWYEAHLECPGLDFYGNFLAGFPMPVIGHSRHHAWGLTILENDDLDFFEEKTDSLHQDQYFYKGEWKKMDIRNEVIKVKDNADFNLTCRSTIHGPVCTDVIHDFKDITSSPVSACWVLTQFPGNLFEGTYGLMTASSLEEFQKTISIIHSPGLNVVYGDSAGNIAWWATSKLVKRHSGINPTLLLDGSSGNDDWLGFYDFEMNPRSVNPSSGFLYTCNNAPETRDSVWVPGYFTPEDRALRVTSFLNRQESFTGSDMQSLQGDVISTVAADLAHFACDVISDEVRNKSELHGKAFEILKKWDGNHGVDNTGTTIFYKLEYEILWNAMGDELGKKDFAQFQSTHIEKNSLQLLFQNDSSAWYDDLRTKDIIESRAMIFNRAFDSAVVSLQKQLGDDIDTWNWGRVHILEHVHPVGRQKPFNHFFNVGPYPMPGGNETVNAEGFDLEPDGVYRIKYGPAIRRTLDFADPEHAQSILPTGQSGNFMSKHYDDQAELFTKNKARTELMNRKEIEENSKEHLVLQPLKY